MLQAYGLRQGICDKRRRPVADRPKSEYGMLRPVRIEPVTLAGRHVRLEPLSQQHQAALCAVGCDEDIWRWNPQQAIGTPQDMQAYIDSALQQQAEGSSLPFATIEAASGRAVGSTRFTNIDRANRRPARRGR